MCHSGGKQFPLFSSEIEISNFDGALEGDWREGVLSVATITLIALAPFYPENISGVKMHLKFIFE